MNHCKSQKTRAKLMEQREVDRLEAPAENQGCLVDPDKASENLSLQRTTTSLFGIVNHHFLRTFCPIVPSISPHSTYTSKQFTASRDVE
jgi:hypothetical protein